MPTVDVPLWNREINFSLSIRFGSSCPFAYRSHTYDCVYVYLIHVIHFPRKISASNIICERYIYIYQLQKLYTLLYIFLWMSSTQSWLKLQNTTSVASLIHFLGKRNETLAKVSWFRMHCVRLQRHISIVVLYWEETEILAILDCKSILRINLRSSFDFDSRQMAIIRLKPTDIWRF